MSDRVLDVLTEAAGSRLGALVPTVDPLARVGTAVQRDRSRRTAAAMAAATLSVVLVLVAFFVAVPRLTADPVIPAVPQPSYPTVRGTVSIDGVEWPLAGELMTDPDFVAGAAAQIDEEFTSEHPGSTEKATVIFADDLGDWRVVIAQYAVGEPRVAFGPRGAAAAQLVGSRWLPNPGDPGGPIAVLLPDDGTGGHLLVVAASGVAVEVAASQAVWPQTAPPYQAVVLGDGAAVLPFAPAVPFGVWPNALAARAQTTDGLVGAWSFGVGTGVEEDVARLDAELVGPWAAGLDVSVQDDARAAADAALRLGRFAEDPTLTLQESMVVAENVTAGVVVAESGGVCSRALSVSTSHRDGSGRSLISVAPALSVCDSVDPRPLVVQDVRGAGGPLSVVWVGVPNAGITVRVSPDASRNDLAADADGFLLVQARTVEVLAVKTRDGRPLWGSGVP